MDTSVVLAVISLVASIGTAALSARFARRQGEKNAAAQRDLEVLKDDLQRRTRHEQDVTSARAQLNRYREPLLLAVGDLGNRLDNIRNRGFLAYLDAEGPRREAAMLSTLFRVARYFARFEMLYQGVGFLKFERDEDTRAVATRLGAVQHAFVTDRYERFMLWREEQRAIGELMCTAGVDGSMECAGYARFVEDFDARYARWFAGFRDDLRSAGVEQDERLAELQRTLAELMIELDDEELFVRAGADGPVAPAWVARAAR